MGESSSSVSPIRRLIDRVLGRKKKRFTGSSAYWEQRYKQGKTSGSGSYGRLAEFKAEIIHQIRNEFGLRSFIEFGCGDGNQLSLLDLDEYTGLDVSSEAVTMCSRKFAGRDGYRFVLYTPASYRPAETVSKADCTMSLDVIYHLVEDEVVDTYMSHLFDSAERCVIVYSSNHEQPPVERAQHVRHRRFTDWVRDHRPQWTLAKEIPNRYPLDVNSPDETSHADFYIYTR